MRKFYLSALMALAALLAVSCQNDDFDPDYPADEVEYNADRRILVAYFSQTGNTEALANQIVELTGADVYRIQPSEPYATNPYDDSDRIQNESYSDLRPGVANLPESVADYDVILVGSPIWWHNPAMVVCTFLENYDLSGKIIVPFFTYGSTEYLQQSIDKIHEVTPASPHLRTYSGGSVEEWLREIHVIQ